MAGWTCVANGTAALAMEGIGLDRFDDRPDGTRQVLARVMRRTEVRVATAAGGVAIASGFLCKWALRGAAVALSGSPGGAKGTQVGTSPAGDTGSS